MRPLPTPVADDQRRAFFDVVDGQRDGVDLLGRESLADRVERHPDFFGDEFVDTADRLVEFGEGVGDRGPLVGRDERAEAAAVARHRLVGDLRLGFGVLLDRRALYRS